MFQWIKNKLGLADKQVAGPGGGNPKYTNMLMSRYRLMKSKYDLLQKTVNDNHFKLADGLSANLANSPSVRRTLRIFSRYEIANNSYAKGVILTHANELVGTGPRLQIRVPGLDDELTRKIEADYYEWAEESGFNDALHTFVQAKVGDGEAFGLMTTDPDLEHPVKLTVLLLEAEQVATPNFTGAPGRVDGIEINNLGKPKGYTVLDHHPGDGYSLIQNATRYDARFFLHWFRRDRPGQFRGVPELTQSLPLFAQLRRWTGATLTGAETAANFAAILYADGTIEGTFEGDPWDEVSISAGMFTTIPAGYKMDQLEPKQPHNQYDTFKRELLKEIGRSQNMPHNILSGDSSVYNYASGRLDHQNWFRAVRVSRSQLHCLILKKVLRAYLNEARLTGILPRNVAPSVILANHTFFWDGTPYVDPVKDGQGDKLALENCTDTLSNICGLQGRDWREVVRQRGVEVAYMRENGLDLLLPDYSDNVQKDIAKLYNEDTGDDDELETKINREWNQRGYLNNRNLRNSR